MQSAAKHHIPVFQIHTSTMKLPFLLLLLATGLSKVGLSPTLPPATPERGARGLASGRVPQAAPLTDSTAEKMLVFQRSIGGWPKAVGSKKVDYKHPLGAAERAATLADKSRNDATIDNNATTREIAYLAQAYQATNNAAYRQGAETGIRYLLKMQYANGGFPQYYPDFSNYRHQITYNDNAMVRVLEVLRDVAKQKVPYVGLDAGLAPLAQAAVARGVQCILKTQYVRGGHPTAWCAQYDEKTLQPAKARAFELASLSGDESVDLVRFLMGIEQPSAAEKAAVECAIDWFQQVKLTNTTVQEVTDPQTHKVLDRQLVPQPGATVWARFYELNTDRPIFVGRDSQVHYQLADIEIERRAGYLYAGTWPEKLLSKDFPAWQKRLSAAAHK